MTPFGKLPKDVQRAMQKELEEGQTFEMFELNFQQWFPLNNITKFDDSLIYRKAK